MKPLKFSILLSILLLVSCEEPVWYRQCLFSNENASLYILNFSDKELFADFYIENGNTEQIKLEPKKAEIVHKDSAYAEHWDEAKDDFLFLSFDDIKGGLQTLDGYSFPFKLLEEDKYCSDLLNTKIQKIEIKDSDNSMLYKSNLSLQNITSKVVIADASVGGAYPYEIQKNFKNEDFLFLNKPGDYLFIDCDVDFSEKPKGYYGTVKNPRYIIVIK